jgi:oxygen-independent coproporphyrinogen-3 oxidase
MTAAVTFDPDLLRRYDRPGPRYTSYPTAPQFATTFGEKAFRRHARASNQTREVRSLSLYVHVPYCFSPCFYCGCNRVITRDLRRGEPYVQRLVREIEQIAPLFEIDREVVQIHLGGGTPNFLGRAQIRQLLESLRANFRLSAREDRDYSIELDPRYVQPGDIDSYAELGFTRASIGVQDFDPLVQKAVNREQSVEQTLVVIDACRAQGLRSLNIDLIYGLPRQTLNGFGRTLDSVLQARPERLSIYGYAHLPEVFKAQRQIDSTELPDPASKLALLQLAVERLTAAGYCHIGMDHFALPDDDLALAQERGGLQRNFMGYTTHANSDLLGFGVSAISHIGASFSQNPRELPAWEAAIDSGRLPVWRGMELSHDDVLRADVIQQLMCQGEIDIATIEHRHGIDFDRYFERELEALSALESDTLVTVGEAHITATSRGKLLLRIIAMCFDHYLAAASAPDSRPRYSRVI